MNFRRLNVFGFAFLISCSLASACDQCGSSGVSVQCGSCSTSHCNTSPCAPSHHHGLLPRLFGKQSCSDCEVHVHYVKSCDRTEKKQPEAAKGILPARSAANNSQQLTYSQVMPASAGMGMPMMMPMMMPYPVQMMGMQTQQAPRQQTANTGCAECIPRVDRLERGVQVLAERMDKIESILENQTAALLAITKSLKETTDN